MGPGERLRGDGLPRSLLGEGRIGDLRLLGGGEGERLLTGDPGLRRGGVSPRLTGEASARRRIGGESGRRLGDGSGCRLGDSILRFGGVLLRGGEAGFLRGDGSLRCCTSFSAQGAPFSL